MKFDKISPELAELAGIIAGDGHLSRYISPKRTDYKIVIVGHKEDDLAYFSEVKKLFLKEFLIEPKITIKKSYIELKINSKILLELFENLGIPVGRKSGIVFIPEKIFQDKELLPHFLRGFADTDFSMVFRKRKTVADYPRITVDIKSEKMINQICESLTSFGMKVNGPYRREREKFGKLRTTYQVDICGHENFKKWMEIIGFRNEKHLKKIKKWDENARPTESPPTRI